MSFVFRNRKDAAKKLAQALLPFKNLPNRLVLALPRGGVPIGFGVAKALDAPLEVFIVRKLGCPKQEELAMGAIASGGILVRNEDIIEYQKVSETEIQAEVLEQQREIKRREELYGRTFVAQDLVGKNVFLVDDGVATGSTVRAAIKAIHLHHPQSVIVGIPVGDKEVCRSLEKEVTELICLHQPDRLLSVGQWYEDFSQTTDEEVQVLLEEAQR